MKHTVFFCLTLIAIPLYPMKYERIEETDLYSQNINSSSYEFDKTLQVKGELIHDMVFAPQNSNTLYAGYSDDTVRIWDINNNSYQELPKTAYISVMAINTEGTILATGSWKQAVTLFDITTKIITKKLMVKRNERAVDKYANDVSCLAFSTKEKILAAGLGGDGSVYGQNINTIALFNTETYTQDTLTGPMGLRLGRIALNPHNTKELIATSYGKVTFWDIEKKKCTREVNNEMYDCSYVRDIAFHPLESIFFTSRNLSVLGPCSQYIEMWDAPQQKIVKRIPLKGFDKKGIALITISPNCKEIIASGHDHTQIFDVGTHKLIQSLPNKQSSFGCCACSSSVNRPGHNSAIHQVAVSTDGKNLATRGGTIKIWNRD